MSDEKVVSLHGDPLPEPGKPVASVVEALDKLLASARAGAISGFVFAQIGPDDQTEWQSHGFVYRFSMVGAIEIAKAEIISGLRENLEILPPPEASA